MKKGFTLIELLIVIAVISILIGIALPRFRGMQEEAKIVQAKAELRTLQVAVESYYIHSSPHAYPATLTSLITAKPNIIGDTVPTDPFNEGNAYGYLKSTPIGRYYAIWSVGLPPTGTITASNDTTGAVTESAEECIYITNGSPRDPKP